MFGRFEMMSPVEGMRFIIKVRMKEIPCCRTSQTEDRVRCIFIGNSNVCGHACERHFSSYVLQQGHIGSRNLSQNVADVILFSAAMQHALFSLLMNSVNCSTPLAGLLFVIKPTRRASHHFSTRHVDTLNYQYFGNNPFSSLFSCVSKYLNKPRGEVIVPKQNYAYACQNLYLPLIH